MLFAFENKEILLTFGIFNGSVHFIQIGKVVVHSELLVDVAVPGLQDFFFPDVSGVHPVPSSQSVPHLFEQRHKLQEALSVLYAVKLVYYVG